MPKIQKPVITDRDHNCKHFDHGWQWNWVPGMTDNKPMLVMVCSECGANCAMLPMIMLKTSGITIPKVKEIKSMVVPPDFKR